MNTIYIGTRITHEDINTLLNRGVARLNQGLSKTCRKVAMDKGIKQTEKGKRLEFYSVTNDEFSQLTDESSQFLSKLAGKPDLRPLIAMDQEIMRVKLKSVNSKLEYQGGMKHSVGLQYQRDLRSAISESITKIGDDVGYIKKTRPTYTHDYTVGDWIEVRGDYGGINCHAKIIKTTPKTYSYQLAQINGKRWNNFESAKQFFSNVTGRSSACNQDWDFTIPFESNESDFTFESVIYKKHAAERNPSIVVPGYRSKHQSGD
jgi:hypothetical protein